MAAGIAFWTKQPIKQTYTEEEERGKQGQREDNQFASRNRMDTHDDHNGNESAQDYDDEDGKYSTDDCMVTYSKLMTMATKFIRTMI